MIGALKAYRTVTGCDLATAQRGVEEIKARMAQPAPKV
jgi:ribosomal protein L7/L12